VDNLLALVLFLVGSVGCAHIVVDGSIFQWLRDTPDWIKKKLSFLKVGKFRERLFWFLDKITGLLQCHQCTGFWCGFITSLIIIPNITCIQAFFLGGGAASILSYWFAIYLNYLEAQTFISLPKQEDEE
jgi:hypothetical protein